MGLSCEKALAGSSGEREDGPQPWGPWTPTKSGVEGPFEERWDASWERIKVETREAVVTPPSPFCGAVLLIEWRRCGTSERRRRRTVRVCGPVVA